MKNSVKLKQEISVKFLSTTLFLLAFCGLAHAKSLSCSDLMAGGQGTYNGNVVVAPGSVCELVGPGYVINGNFSSDGALLVAVYGSLLPLGTPGTANTINGNVDIQNSLIVTAIESTLINGNVTITDTNNPDSFIAVGGSNRTSTGDRHNVIKGNLTISDNVAGVTFISSNFIEGNVTYENNEISGVLQTGCDKIDGNLTLNNNKTGVAIGVFGNCFVDARPDQFPEGIIAGNLTMKNNQNGFGISLINIQVNGNVTLKGNTDDGLPQTGIVFEDEEFRDRDPYIRGNLTCKNNNQAVVGLFTTGTPPGDRESFPNKVDNIVDIGGNINCEQQF